MENRRIGSIRRHSDFEKLKKVGFKVYPTRWLLIVYSDNDNESLQIGYTISRKVGSAVIRNRLRRWGKEFFRLNSVHLTRNLKVNIVFRPMGEDFYNDLKHKKLDEALNRAIKQIFNISN